MPNWAHVFQPLLSLCWESPCPVCQRSTAHILCPDCDRQLRRCQHPHPQQAWQPPLPVFVWGTYGGALKRAIGILKYDGQPALAQPMGQWLGQAWTAAALAPQRLTVVPIPLHASKQRQRGYNQAERVAQAFCQTTGLPLWRGLARVRSTEAQFGLSIEQRAHNLAGAFQLSSTPRRHAAPVLLLDDIYTTGATVRAATEALRQHGVEVCGVVAVAAPLMSARTERNSAGAARSLKMDERSSKPEPPWSQTPDSDRAP